ncbi:hypothetical protein DESME_14755 [Desulfitobacterium metallireducens DSM 15288]|uniref:Uncharacterized protein n=1 Tax=Desulfitobacterium metallireducens DSM 15288 TaxID=871968 RepID=W0ECW9_9FIRM|nr:hypothetical protein DESME_14755 [Desulfitobacterium metallireducens DSM 15288]
MNEKKYVVYIRGSVGEIPRQYLSESDILEIHGKKD